MSIKTLFAAALLATSLFSSELKITGIVLTSAADNLEQYADAKGVVIQDLLFASSLDRELEQKFLDQPLTEESPQQIKDAILQFYRSHQHSMVVVRIPEQEISNGAVVCEVIEPRAGTVTFRCNRWFPDCIFQRQLQIQSGDVIDEAKILNGLAWLNRNPFHQTQLVIAPGEKRGEPNLEFVTQDRFPWRFFVGVDNTGTIPTDQIRLFAGANWGNAFNHDDLFSVQYTTSPDFHRFMSGFGSYTCFLPWKHAFTLFGAYARIHPNISHFTSSGTEIQGSARYAIPFKPLYANLLHELTMGLDFKAYNNALFFTEVSPTIPVIERKIDLTQLYLGYKLDDTIRNNDVTFKAEVFGSPVKWLPHQTNTDYETLRPNAKVRYIYGKVALGDIVTVRKDVKLAWLVRGQLSSGPLLPSEQFALGGYDTVRGYDELDFTADNAVCVNLEIRTPEWHPGRNRKLNDRLFFLAFVDYGWGRNDQVALELPVTQTLVGVGPGIRYTVLPYLNARLDYGFQLHHIFDDHRFGKFHFSVVASY